MKRDSDFLLETNLIRQGIIKQIISIIEILLIYMIL